MFYTVQQEDAALVNQVCNGVLLTRCPFLWLERLLLFVVSCHLHLECVRIVEQICQRLHHIIGFRAQLSTDDA